MLEVASLDEFICYKILHAVLRDNHLELICTLREIPAVQVFTQYLLNIYLILNLVSKYLFLEGPEYLYYVCPSVRLSVCLSVCLPVCLSVCLSYLQLAGFAPTYFVHLHYFFSTYSVMVYLCVLRILLYCY